MMRRWLTSMVLAAVLVAAVAVAVAGCGSQKRTIPTHTAQSFLQQLDKIGEQFDNGSCTGASAKVAALSPNDVWAVGYSTDGTGDHPLIEHYDGASWTQVTGAGVIGQGSLAAVSAAGASDVWAVGSVGGGSTKTLVEHWNGAAWARIPSPSPSRSENDLLGVSARGGSDAWAVGYYASSSGHKSLVEHWNGSAWSVR